MKKILYLFLLLLFAGCSSKSKEVKVSLNCKLFNCDAAYSNLVDIVDIGTRDSGTVGAYKASRYLLSKLESYGLAAEVSEFTDDTPVGKIKFRNVVARIPGDTNIIIVLLSHYDTKSGISKNFVGANDSGSSSAVLLEIASILSKSEFSPEVIIAFVDGEECIESYSEIDGLHGSKRLARMLINDYGRTAIKAVIDIDMVGDKDLSLTIPENSSRRLVSMLIDSSYEEGIRKKVSIFPRMIDDHLPFLQQNIPAVDIIDFQYGSKPGLNDYWHTDKDTIDKISKDSLCVTGRLILRILNKINKEWASQ